MHFLKTLRGLTASSFAILAVCGLFSPSRADVAIDVPRPAPEAGTGTRSKSLATAQKYMVTAANPYAVEAGREMLRAGGTATDAAIAVQLVLGLVEPQSSGLGGGLFLLHWDEAVKELKTYDGRETAPAAAKPDRFLVNGKPMAFDTAVASGLSVGVPGALKALELAHQRHGRLPWAKLFEPAIRLAEQGFDVSTRLNLLLRWNGADSFAPAARAYFFDDGGNARGIGSKLTNPEYAATLKVIATGGAKAFYDGPIAEAIVAAAAAAPHVKSDLTLGDLATYQAKERSALCTDYRSKKICGMGPPSSGGPTVAQTLGLIEPFESVRGADKAMSAAAMHIIAEAEKLAYADRNRYLGDPDFVQVPGGMLDAAYLAERRKLIDPAAAMKKPSAGLPPGLARQSQGLDATVERAGTSHVSIIDGEGNAVSMTTTIEGAFGSHLWAAGFLLNNELTDFSFAPADAEGRPLANAPAASKRPRSSMAPTMVFDHDGRLEMVLGSPGGSRIILFVVKALVAMIDWGYDPQQAAAEINFGSEGGPLFVEYSAMALWYGIKLTTFGHNVDGDLMTSGLHIIRRRNGVLEGAADPRREGVALGD